MRLRHLEAMLKRLTLFLCLAVAGQATLAGGLSDGALVRIDVLDGGPSGQGGHQAALHLKLADGWKTYWRAPGDAGIPPIFAWHGSRNIEEIEILWPTPVVFDQNGMRSIGYKDELVLPLKIKTKRAQTPVRISGTIEFGICKDVCIPAELSFAAELDRKSGRDPRIVAALAQVPFSAREAGVTKAVCTLRPVQGGIQVEARLRMPPIDGRETVVFEPSDPTLWSSEVAANWEGSTLVARGKLAPTDGGIIALDRSTLTITVIGTGRSVEINGCSQG